MSRSTTPAQPTASAVRRMVPRLPGYCTAWSATQRLADAPAAADAVTSPSAPQRCCRATTATPCALSRVTSEENTSGDTSRSGTPSRSRAATNARARSPLSRSRQATTCSMAALGLCCAASARCKPSAKKSPLLSRASRERASARMPFNRGLCRPTMMLLPLLTLLMAASACERVGAGPAGRGPAPAGAYGASGRSRPRRRAVRRAACRPRMPSGGVVSG
ncbi:MAG TPA: hypothetical protein VM490_17965 [Armatimonadaceae bacterium]|nr:hypothetical protein [Armatimonadaceae bacterium]